MLGRYELLERIAIGGMAEVFRGRVVGAAGFEKHVAIKRILPTFSRDDRFIKALVNEAKIASSMSQANIVQMHDIGVAEDGQYFLVMEFVDGRDLRTVLERLSQLGKRLTQDLAMYIIAEITEALDYVHRRADPAGNPLRLVHRDVSPPNILISRNGEVKLADFGIAKRASEQSVVSTLKGKFSYMSPEQSRLAPLDHTTDLFSLGAVLYELMCGRRAFTGASDLETLLLVREARYVAPRDLDPRISPELEAIIARALAVKPKERFQMAAEMGAALREVRFSQTEASGGGVELARVMNELFPVDMVRTVDPPRRDVITLSTMVRRDENGLPVLEEPGPSPVALVNTPEPAPTLAMGPLPLPPGRARLLALARDATNEFAAGATGDSVIVEIDHMLGLPKHRATPPPMPLRSPPAPPAPEPPPRPRERRETPTAKFETIAKDLRSRRDRPSQAPTTAPEPIPLTRRKARSGALRTVIIATLFGAVGATGALGVFVAFGGLRGSKSEHAERLPQPPPTRRDAGASRSRAVDAAPPVVVPVIADAAPADAAPAKPPADAAPSASSWVTLRSDPTGARVEVDDEPLCTTSCGKELKSGRRRFRFSLLGYQPWSEIVELSTGEHREIRVQLTPIPPPPPPRTAAKPKPKPRHR